MRYLIEPRGYEFLSFPKNMGKNISESISKNLNSKCSQNNINKKIKITLVIN